MHIYYDSRHLYPKTAKMYQKEKILQRITRIENDAQNLTSGETMTGELYELDYLPIG